MSTTSTTTPSASKHFTSSILLWMRDDQPRQTGMDHWRGPHSGIIAQTPGLEEYRQIHLAEHNPGLWPATEGLETAIPVERKIDGIAEVTFQSALSPLAGRTQTALAFDDEVNVFRRTLLYAGPPNSSRRYHVGPSVARTGSRAIMYLRRRDGVGSRGFHKFVGKQLVPALADTGALTELRTQVFLPWSRAPWNTPDVAHDNPVDQRFHASVILGFVDDAARASFFANPEMDPLSALLAARVSAIHAYDVAATLTYVTGGKALPRFEE